MEVAAPVAIVPYWSYIVVPAAMIFFGIAQMIVLIVINKKTSGMATLQLQIKESADNTAVSVEKAHVAINNERSTMQQELKTMHETILNLTKELAQRDQEVKDRK